jgi:predicted DNA binding CopG/RHH family protein
LQRRFDISTMAKKKKKNTSLRLNAEMLKALKHRAVEQETSVQRILEKLIDDYLGSGKRNGH